MALRRFERTSLWPGPGSIAKLFRQNPLIEIMIGIEHHEQVDVRCLGNLDLDDRAEFDVVRDRADRPRSKSRYSNLMN